MELRHLRYFLAVIFQQESFGVDLPMPLQGQPFE